MRRSMVGVALAFLVGTASAAFTGALSAFQPELAAASAGLSGLTDPVSVKRKKAVDRSLAAVLAYSTSLGKDLSNGAKISRLLEKAYPAEDPLLADLDGALDGLEAAVVDARDLLAAESTLLVGAKRSAAEGALASVDGSLVLAGLSSTRTLRAGLLKKAEHRASAARKSLRKGAPAGFQGPVNGSFEVAGADATQAAYWDRAGSHPRFGSGTPSVFRQTTGTATHGLADEFINGEYWIYALDTHVATLAQSGVLLSRSTRLLFDYKADVDVGLCTTAGPDLGNTGVGRLEVLFSLDAPAVTVVLWTREFPAGVTVESAAGQAVDLPFLPSAGTLIFRVTTTGGVDCGTFVLGSDTDIRIDNVRVE